MALKRSHTMHHNLHDFPCQTKARLHVPKIVHTVVNFMSFLVYFHVYIVFACRYCFSCLGHCFRVKKGGQKCSHGIVNGTAVSGSDLQPREWMSASVLLQLLFFARGFGDDTRDNDTGCGNNGGSSRSFRAVIREQFGCLMMINDNGGGSTSEFFGSYFRSCRWMSFDT